MNPDKMQVRHNALAKPENRTPVVNSFWISTAKRMNNAYIPGRNIKLLFNKRFLRFFEAMDVNVIQ
ncbi:MAG TPA: hypothetical protein PKY83_01595 [Bacteroidales bacterium]|jgi:hypothetical protein|nr:hypothetical protein [Bacteroidales bacterium]MCZ2417624.1 hypothetical protein [Burkholderiales bacterium]MCZ2317037.1 hypothetical protein [Bacteroidales bacterium]HNW22081.1 hypothetical protein [Bacteroidales bacterium]HNZ46217.1 hypothetical protein [Bacteroidales bacterium]